MLTHFALSFYFVHLDVKPEEVMCFFPHASDPGPASRPEQTLCAAVAATTKIAPKGGTGKMEFALAWDMPIIHFGNKNKNHYR